MPANSGGFILATDTLTSLFASQIGGDLVDSVENTLEGFVEEVQEYAQANAPWADRTGEARASLEAEVTTEGDSVLLILSHGVDYGEWLETIQSGRYAIIMPTLEHFAGQIFAATGATPEAV